MYRALCNRHIREQHIECSRLWKVKIREPLRISNVYSPVKKSTPVTSGFEGSGMGLETLDLRPITIAATFSFTDVPEKVTKFGYKLHNMYQNFSHIRMKDDEFAWFLHCSATIFWSKPGGLAWKRNLVCCSSSVFRPYFVRETLKLAPRKGLNPMTGMKAIHMRVVKEYW